jgi:hypothetical protein
MLKKSLSGMMALFIGLMLVFTMAGCNNPTGGGGGDTWSNITSLNQVHGTWKMSFTQSMPIREYMENVRGQTWTIQDAIAAGDMRVIYSFESTQNINANTGIMTGTVTDTTRFTGGNINTVWSTFKQIFSAAPGFSMTFNDSNHSMIVTGNILPGLVSVGDFVGSQINQNGTRIRILAGVSYPGSPEIIATKQ